ncbi:hypothetical protein N7539_007936 [Penicillium diatomitis]|uniref:Uncharacterized protein n=1 Tax=Penicillium diatomitis TaxID=2819901 RepID=A0A9X0BNK5_9EURO|nr:uncharacterized protein N7539_007936 [Penicillium diatomitis]KAJ5475649.1 hypothetical protein N7539_007936 [Penicillium diatomitis]
MSYSPSTSYYSPSLASTTSGLPYHHTQPMSSLSLASQSSRRTSTSAKSPRFYSSPVQDGYGTPVQLYGLERREPSIHEKPKRSRRISYALGGIEENLSSMNSDTTPMRATANKIRRRPTLRLGSSPVPPVMAPSPRIMEDGASTPQFPPESAWSISTTQTSGFARRLTRRLSVFSMRRKTAVQSGREMPSPDSIGSPLQHGSRLQPTFA